MMTANRTYVRSGAGCGESAGGIDGLAGTPAGLGELVGGAGEADLESFDFAGLALVFGLADPADQVAADLGDAGPLGAAQPRTAPTQHAHDRLQAHGGGRPVGGRPRREHARRCPRCPAVSRNSRTDVCVAAVLAPPAGRSRAHRGCIPASVPPGPQSPAEIPGIRLSHLCHCAIGGNICPNFQQDNIRPTFYVTHQLTEGIAQRPGATAGS